MSSRFLMCLFSMVGLVVSCGHATPCSGGSLSADGGANKLTCFVDGQDITGTYDIVINPALTCSLWADDAQPSSVMLVSADDQGNVEVSLDPGLADNPHLLVGTEYVGGQISASEQLNPALGIPNSHLNGAFSVGSSGLQFMGSLTLTQLAPPASASGSGGATSGFATSGGTGSSTNPCSSTYSVTASEEAGGI